MQPHADGDAGPLLKKQRLNTETSELTIPMVNADFLCADRRVQLREQIAASQPYTHCVLESLFDPAALCEVRDELINNIQATYKETDLFKVFQTGDLANMDALDIESSAKLPALLRLRDSLYSETFRNFVRDITGCGELSGRTDCSCNVYPQGGHLLCHDDVIGTRRVSYIIYLTDPDEPWTVGDGGALELYPLLKGEEHTPVVDPTVSHLPTWNTMAMFVVQPGKSFHAVQEVYCDSKPRLSISGWYHAPELDPEHVHASLAQLQFRAGSDAVQAHSEFEGSATNCDPTDEDLALLSRFVNPVYLKREDWPRVQRTFEAEGSVQLHNFLSKGLAARVRAAALRLDQRDQLGGGQRPQYGAGVAEGWMPVGPPHKQRYLRYEGAAAQPSDVEEAANDHAAPDSCSADAGALLRALQERLFRTGAFARLLHALTTITLVGHAGETRRFRPGLDYTVAHYGVLTRDPRLDCVLSFVDDASEDAAAAWATGDVGGFEAYLLADEDDGAAAPEVYRKDDDESGVINVAAASNSLNLLLRDEGLMRFVKYVSYLAPSSRFDVAMEYRPEDDSDDEAPNAEASAQADVPDN